MAVEFQQLLIVGVVAGIANGIGNTLGNYISNRMILKKLESLENRIKNGNRKL